MLKPPKHMFTESSSMNQHLILFVRWTTTMEWISTECNHFQTLWESIVGYDLAIKQPRAMR